MFWAISYKLCAACYNTPHMFSQERKGLIFPIIAGVILLVAAFGSGYYLGSKNFISSAPPVSLSNTDSDIIVATSTVDFAPFWKAWNILSERYVSKKKIPDDQDKVWGAISGLASSMDDPYTVFFPPTESKAFADTINGEFGGVGMEVGLRDRAITVIAPLKDTPAYNAGIKAGDKVMKIDGKPTTDMTVDEAVNLIRGKKGTDVSLSLFRDGVNKPIEVKITRDIIKIPTIDTEKRKDGIFVIKLYSFSASSPDLFRNALRDFVQSGEDKLLLDLRGNPGGYLEAAVDMASWFLPAGKIIVSEDSGKTGGEKIYRSKGYNIFTDKLKFVILVNQGSASASEILAGALSEHGVAKLVGERTFGKGSVQELLPITADTSLKVTIARWLTPKGTSISEGGLKPDIEIVPTDDDITKNKDIQLEKAVSILLGQ